MKSYAMVFSPVDAAGTDSSVCAWNYELRGGDDTALPAGSTAVYLLKRHPERFTVWTGRFAEVPHHLR